MRIGGTKDAVNILSSPRAREPLPSTLLCSAQRESFPVTMVGRGRKKTKTTLIEDKKARDVCFCKRRAGLFKKARELSILCGAKVGILIFSSSGKPKIFDAPTLETFIDQTLRHRSSDDIPNLESESPPPAAGAEKMAPFWWERPDVSSMTLDELKTFASSLSAAIEERNKVKDGNHDFDAEGKMMGANLFTSGHETSSIPEFNEVISSSQSNQMKSHQTLLVGDPVFDENCWNVAASAGQMMDASSFDCWPTPIIEEQMMMDENFFIPGCWPSSTYIGGPQLSISFEDEPSRIDGRQLVAPNLLLGSPAVDASKNASFQPSLTWTDFFMQRQWI